MRKISEFSGGGYAKKREKSWKRETQIKLLKFTKKLLCCHGQVFVGISQETKREKMKMKLENALQKARREKGVLIATLERPLAAYNS